MSNVNRAANIFVRTSEQKARDVSKEISYRNIERVTAQLNDVSSTYAYAAITVPFPQGLIKRVTVFPNGDSDTATLAHVIVSETNNTNRENKILQYSNINIQTDYLDSEEEIYYTSTNSLLYVHVQASGGTSNFYIKLDLERVN